MACAWYSVMPGLIARITSLWPSQLIAAAFAMSAISSGCLIPLKPDKMPCKLRAATGFFVAAIALSTIVAMRDKGSTLLLYVEKISSLLYAVNTESIFEKSMVLALNLSLIKTLAILYFSCTPSTPKIFPVHNSLCGSRF